MVQSVVVVGIALGLTLVAGCTGWVLARVRGHGADPGALEFEAAEPIVVPVPEDIELRLTRMEQKLELLPQTWEAFRDGAIKAEQRARHHARKAARSAQAESEDLEEPEGIRVVDAEGSGDERMLALRNGMGVGSPVDPENELLKYVARIKGYG